MEQPSDIAHVLLIDVVGYSKLLVNAQTELLRELNHVVRAAPCLCEAEAKRSLLKLPTGDGMALLFFDSAESPVKCALEISAAVRARGGIPLRMGIHSGPIKQVNDVNERENFAGSGINIAQRVLDCGDAGHILLSRRVAEDLLPREEWHSSLFDLGECEVKHGLKLHLFNLCHGDVGNSVVPSKVKEQRRLVRRSLALWKVFLRASAARKAVVIASLATVAAVGWLLFYWFGPVKLLTDTVAVLPFANRSLDPKDAFYAASVQDELGETLRSLVDVELIRTSTSTAHPPNANYLIQGSVEQNGDTIRVFAQLIDARRDAEVWIKSYVGPIADLFSLQRQLASDVSKELGARLSLDAFLKSKRRPDHVAYERYLKAKTLIDYSVLSSHAYDDLLEAVDLLNAAIARDAKFFPAYYQLAHARDQIYLRFDRSHQALDAANSAVADVVRTDAKRGETHLAVARHRYWVFRDFEGARKELQLAGPQLPNNPDIALLIGYIDRREGAWASAARNLERARKADPDNPIILQQIYITEFALRHYANATAALDGAIRLLPADLSLRQRRAGVPLEANADPRPLRELIGSTLSTDPSAATKFASSSLYLALCEHDPAAARQALARLGPDGCESDALAIPRSWCEGMVARMSGEETAANDAFGRAADEADRLLADDPNNPRALVVLALTHVGVGANATAIEEGKRAAELLPIRKDALDGAQIAEVLAAIYSLVGERDLALAQLEVVTKQPGYISYGNLICHPYWDPLRNDPRFDKIVAAILH